MGIVEYKGRRVAARLAAGIDPSSWILFDADNPPGMPADWAAMSIQQRLEFWEPACPASARATRVELRASSARVARTASRKRSVARVVARRRCQQDRADEGAHRRGDGDLRAVVPVREEEPRRPEPDRRHRAPSVFDTSVWNRARSFSVPSPTRPRPATALTTQTSVSSTAPKYWTCPSSRSPTRLPCATTA